MGRRCPGLTRKRVDCMTGPGHPIARSMLSNFKPCGSMMHREEPHLCLRLFAIWRCCCATNLRGRMWAGTGDGWQNLQKTLPSTGY
jgi:hypothetical protein